MVRVQVRKGIPEICIHLQFPLPALDEHREETGRWHGRHAAASTRIRQDGPWTRAAGGNALRLWLISFLSRLSLSLSLSLSRKLTSSSLCLVVRPFIGERPGPCRRRPRFHSGGSGVGVARPRKPHALRLRAVSSQPLLPERYPGVALLRSHVENFGVGGIRIPRGQSPGVGRNEREECWGKSSRATHSRDTSRRCLVCHADP